MDYLCFISVNNEGATVELLADLILRGTISLSEIDPCCRAEVESHVVGILHMDYTDSKEPKCS